jgi:hypothetical protein
VIHVDGQIDRDDDGKLTVYGRIRNVGRFETAVMDAMFTWVPMTTLRALVLHGDDHGFAIINDHVVGMDFPQAIKPQSLIEFEIPNIADVDPGIPDYLAAGAVLRMNFALVNGEMVGKFISRHIYDAHGTTRRPSQTLASYWAFERRPRLPPRSPGKSGPGLEGSPNDPMAG